MATFGEVTPSLSTRLVMICCAVCMPAALSVVPLSGTARRTTSIPPCRSSPSVGFLYAGECGIASSTAPTRAAAIAPISRRYLRRSLTKDPSKPRNRLAGLLLIRRGAARVFLVEGGLPSLAAFVLLRLFGLAGFLLGRLAGDACDRAPGDPHLDLRRDLDRDLVLVESRDRTVDPAGGEHLVADAQLAEQLLLLRLPLPLRQDDDQPEQEERDDDDQEETRTAAARSDDQPIAPFARWSASSFHVRNSPRSIACRAAATRSSRKRRLCRLSSRNPRISCWFTRWRM